MEEKLPAYQKWLARLSYTFLILAVLLGWTAYGSLRGYRDPMPTWRIGVHFALAIACMALWAMGVRARHRRLEDDRRGELERPEEDR